MGGYDQLKELSIYVHIPFCPSKCHYCDFNSYKMDGEVQNRSVRATISQIMSSPWKGTPAKTIFFGGGTPTYIDTDLLLSLYEAVIQYHPPVNGCEITSEANPGTVNLEKLKAMRKAGFNRLSLGAQSFYNNDLKMLGRVHDSDDIHTAFEQAREGGFQNINLDLIFGLTHQSLYGWRENLKKAMTLNPEHLSLYALTIEKGTQFYKLHHKNLLPLPSDQEFVKMYSIALEHAKNNGYIQYEISNFCKPEHECKHNLTYWNNDYYLGYGPGAVGYMPVSGENIRYTNIKHPRAYSEAAYENKSFWADTEVITDEMVRKERIMLGLRLNQGIPIELVKPEHSTHLDRMMKYEWLECIDNRFRLTDKGRMLSNDVIVGLM